MSIRRDELQAEGGSYLEKTETVPAVANGVSEPGWGAVWGGELWIADLVDLLVYWLIYPRWRLVVTDRRILALRRRRLFPNRLTGESVSYSLRQLESVRLKRGLLPWGGEIIVVGAATGSKEVHYRGLSRHKPSRAEFRRVLGSLGKSKE